MRPYQIGVAGNDIHKPANDQGHSLIDMRRFSSEQRSGPRQVRFEIAIGIRVEARSTGPIGVGSGPRTDKSYGLRDVPLTSPEAAQDVQGLPRLEG